MIHNRWRPLLFVATAFACVLLITATRSISLAQDKKPRFFELRIYTTHPGRLPALHKRFREHTNRIFKKHGMQLVGYWTPADGPEAKNTLVYMLAFPSRKARETAWKAFRKDPEWQRVFKASRADGPIVKKVQNKFLTPTDYSPIK